MLDVHTRRASTEQACVCADLLDDGVLALALHLEGWVLRLALPGDGLSLGLDGGLLSMLLRHLTCIKCTAARTSADLTQCRVARPVLAGDCA